jgi:hypothetical protein
LHDATAVVAAAAILCCLSLGACRGDEATEAPAANSNASATAEIAATAAVPPVAVRPTIRHRIHPSLPEFTFTVQADRAAASNEAVRVRRIEIRSGTATEPFQIIDGLEAETPLSAGQPELDLIDMNFDGYMDMRMVAFRPAGPNTPYLNWLFDSVSGRFVESRELNEIPSPEFDPASRQIRSSWRDGATRYGTDVYELRNGQPVLVRKEEKTYRAPGVYELRVSQRVADVWKTIEQREVREREEASGAGQPGGDK